METASKFSEIVKNIFGTENVVKTDEQTVRNIIESILTFGIRYNFKPKLIYNILLKKERLADTIVDKDQFIEYLFNLVGEYFMAPIDVQFDFYNKIKVNKPKVVKKIIRNYLDYMAFKPEDVCEMTFSDAIVDMEQTIFFVSKHREILNQIQDIEVKNLIVKWAAKISKTIDRAFVENPPFVE